MISSKNLSLSLVGLIVLNILVVVLADSNNIDLTNPEATSNQYAKFTEKEIKAIEEFREIVSPFLYQSYMRHDQFLIRWIRDSNFNLEAAKGKLLKMIKWRKDNNIDNIKDEDFSSFQKICPYSTGGHDKENRPLGTIAFGKCDVRKMVLSGKVDKFERYMIYFLETTSEAVRQSINSGIDITDAIVIADINGFNLRQHGCLRCIPAFFSFLNYYMSYYPEYLHIGFFINVPRVALPILDILLPTFSQKMLETFKFYGYDRQEWENEIRKYIEPDQLTYQFGGNQRFQS